jgi:peroxiredoxin
VVGLGTQDSFRQAQAFVARHGITFRMLWDRGFSSWNGFGITGQPASVLVSADGRELKRWIGSLSAIERAEVLRLASA